MTSDEIIQAYLSHRWPDGLSCPLCRGNAWFTPPEGPHVIEGLPMSLSVDEEPDAWAPPVGVWLCICSGCGFIVPLLEDFVGAAIKTVDIDNGAGI
ncbi:hypothetical protein LCGC14_0698710 [marine sediment metagenome]|uniref:Uncharacterized protein n=1 Tax=marine sediment metagenome TaxID=412755 RepID=A0A0F9R3S5_9ZZZZ